MELVKSIFDNAPKMLEYEGKSIRINFDVDVTELASDGTDNEELKRTAFSAYVVRVEQPLERGKVIDAIVSAAYPSDKMQAVINNHFANLAKIADGKKLDADELSHEREYNAMQEWRKKAKSVASDVMESYLSNI